MRGIRWTGGSGCPSWLVLSFLVLEFNPRMGENGGHWKRWISSRRSVTSWDKVDCRSIHGAAPLFYIHAYILPPLRVSLSRSPSPPSQFFSFFLFVLFLPCSSCQKGGVAGFYIFPQNASWRTSWTRNRSDLVIDVPSLGMFPVYESFYSVLENDASELVLRLKVRFLHRDRVGDYRNNISNRCTFISSLDFNRPSMYIVSFLVTLSTAAKSPTALFVSCRRLKQYSRSFIAYSLEFSLKYPAPIKIPSEIPLRRIRFPRFLSPAKAALSRPEISSPGLDFGQDGRHWR